MQTSAILFVNGKIGGGSPPAGAAYWDNEPTRESDFVLGAKQYFQTENIFYTAEDYGYFSTANGRQNSGFQYAENHLHLLIPMLDCETILQVVTHSMGAAFAVGIMNWLLRNGYQLGKAVHINAFQAAAIRFPWKPNTFGRPYTIDYQNTDDPVIHNIFYSAPGKMPDADKSILEPSGVKEWMYRHRSPIWKQSGDFWKRADMQD